MTENNSQVAVMQNNNKPFYCSKKAETVEDRKALFNALENCDKLLNECEGEKIAIKDIYIEQYIKKDEMGDTVKYRTIIFAEDGQTYVSTSYGIVNVLQKMISLFGEPATWKEPVTVEVAKRPIGNGKKILTLKLA